MGNGIPIKIKVAKASAHCARPRAGRPLNKVVTIGEILVEIMATEPGDGFLAPIPLVGPFPSGAPAIFIDQVATYVGLSGHCSPITTRNSDNKKCSATAGHSRIPTAPPTRPR